MDDKRISQLVKMAMEAEALDDAPLIAGRISRRPRWGAWTAAAVCALAGGLTIRALWPTSPGVPTVVAEGSKAPIAAPAPGVRVVAAHNDPGGSIVEERESDQFVVLTFYRDSSGDVPCYTWEIQDGCAPVGSGHAASQLNMLGSTACSSEHDSVVTVAIAGPERDLPTSDTDALTLAVCLATLANPAEQDAGLVAAAIESCLPPGLHAAASIASVSR